MDAVMVTLMDMHVRDQTQAVLLNQHASMAPLCHFGHSVYPVHQKAFAGIEARAQYARPMMVAFSN